MRYHPDKSDDPRAEQAFILINEAYEFLSDPNRRKSYAFTTGRERDDARRRMVYEEWVRQGRMNSEQKARTYAHSTIKEFEQSPIFRAAMALDKLYNFVFVGVGVFMVLMPFIWLYFRPDFFGEDYNYFTLVIPVILGMGFLYGLWYFIVKLNE